jgi:transporter family protein
MISSWIIYAILSAVCAALVAIFGKIGISHVDTTLATAIRSVIMAVALVLAALSLGKFDLSKIDNKALIFIALSGLAGALSWFFYFGALKNGPATAVAALDRLSVVFVLVLAVLFLGEALTWKTGLGALLVSLGAILLAL